MKTTLYKIEQEYIDLIGEIEDNGGEITPEQEAVLTINKTELKGKSIAYLEVIKKTELFSEGIDEEVKRLQNMKRRNTTLIDRLKGSLLTAVQIYGEIEVDFVKFGIRKSSKVEILDEAVIEGRFLKIKQSTVIDKTGIKKAIKDGETVKGAEVIECDNLKIN